MFHIIRLTICALAVALFVAGCASDDDGSSSNNPPSQDLAAQLQQIVNSSLSTTIPVHSVLLKIEDPDSNFYWAGAAGMADPAQQIRMTTNHRFRIASVTKPMTATLILRLMEEGLVSLDSTAWCYLRDTTEVNFDSLHVWLLNSYGRDITLRQLLNHTSGLPDYVFDGTPDQYGFTPFMRYALDHPEKMWQPHEMVQWSYRHLYPWYRPGWMFHYSDTGYVLLGMIAERVTGRALADLYREYIFTPLGMTQSYLEFFEPAQPGGELSHPFLSTIDLMEYNTSFDWAGGGVVSSADDLLRFLHALMSGELFQSASTHDLMFSWVSASGSHSYGLGVDSYVTSLGEFIGHPGAYGSFAYYWQERGIYAVGTLNQVQSDPEGLLTRMADLLQ